MDTTTTSDDRETRTPSCDEPRIASSSWLRFPLLPLLASLGLAAFALFPPVNGNPRLSAAFVGVAMFLVVWLAVLWVIARRRGRSFQVALAPPQRSHFIQAGVQFSIYAYWGWYWRNVYEAVPLILAQLVFLYVFEALLTWSRGRVWRLGCGPMPIIFSTNFFLWFKDDWFVFQFAMIAASALAKEFIRWERDGKRTHVFNPSAFGLALVSIVLIATGTTRLTWGIEVATTLARPPHIFLEIFLLGLIVQYFFSVTLMTVSAVVSLCLADLAYTWATGTHYFVDTNIPIAIFLGMHLLMTDPATSPKSNLGRVLFGTAYGLANFVLFWLLGSMGVPDFYDKLLPVPILNLCVPWIDRWARSGVFARFTRWELNVAPRKLNLIHMGSWTAIFAVMLGTGYVDAPHPGNSIAFWKRAYDEGKPFAGRNLVKIVGSMADAGNPSASNQLGLIYLDGRMVERDPRVAAYSFAQACARGHVRGCENVVWQLFSQGYAHSAEAVDAALGQLEAQLGRRQSGRACGLLAFAYETGARRPLDRSRAMELFRAGAALGDLDSARGCVRLAGSFPVPPDELAAVRRLLEQGRAVGDAASCEALVHLHQLGLAGPSDLALVRELLTEACALGSQAACAALQREDLVVSLQPSIGARISPLAGVGEVRETAGSNHESGPPEHVPSGR